MAKVEGRRLRVLLVEDEFLICMMMADVLAEHGFEVRAAANARDALAHLTRGAPCDVLLTDLNLGPGLDGSGLAKLARELRPHLPVVYVSGSVRRIEELEPVPGAAFIAKPYVPEKVCEMLGEIGASARDGERSERPARPPVRH
jgi:two-component system OmpR family response regulator